MYFLEEDLLMVFLFFLHDSKVYLVSDVMNYIGPDYKRSLV